MRRSVSSTYTKLHETSFWNPTSWPVNNLPLQRIPGAGLHSTISHSNFKIAHLPRAVSVSEEQFLGCCVFLSITGGLHLYWPGKSFEQEISWLISSPKLLLESAPRRNSTTCSWTIQDAVRNRKTISEIYLTDLKHENRRQIYQKVR